MDEVGQNHPSILLVDDDEVFRTRLAKAFAKRGHVVCQASNVSEALHEASTHSPDYVLLDLSMPGGSGIEVIEPLLKMLPRVKTVVLTGYGSIASAVEAMKLGASNYVSKPADVDTILEAFGDSVAVSVEHRAPDLAAVEWEHIQRVLLQCEGNISKAARVLGLHRRSLQRKLGKAPRGAGSHSE